MPPRSAPGIRMRMEELYTDSELRTLDACCPAFVVSRERWHEIPALARPFELLAWTRLAQAYQDDGLGAEKAELWSSLHLGLSLSTMRSRQCRAVPTSSHNAEGTAA